MGIDQSISDQIKNNHVCVPRQSLLPKSEPVVMEVKIYLNDHKFGVGSCTVAPKGNFDNGGTRYPQL